MDRRDNDIHYLEESKGGVGGFGSGSGSEALEKDLRAPLLGSRINTGSQLALVGSKVCSVESLDYEIIENDLFKQDWRSRKKVQIFQYIVLKWTLPLLIGLATGLVGFFNNFAVENIAGYKLLVTGNLMLDGRYGQAFLTLAGCNLALAAASAAICAYIAPAAAGSGIPEVKSYLNGVDAYSILAPSTLFVKIFGSIGGVSAGFVLGKEGPMVHTGACIANLLGQGGSRKYNLTWQWLRYFKSDRDRRDLITCGAGAGVAAAFLAPVGGVLFALEEAASWWRSALLWRTFFTTAVVAIVLRALIEICRSGECGLFGGGLIMFDISSAYASFRLNDLFHIIVLGIIGGLLGSLFNYLLDKILRLYSVINERGPPFKIMLTCAISLLTTCSAFGLPWLVSCTACPASLQQQCPTISRSGNFKIFTCPSGHYNDLASLLLNTNNDAIRNLFSSNTDREFHLSTLVIFFVAIFILGLFTYGVALPAGLFIPVILAGASYGRFAGRIFRNYVSGLDTGLFALLGSASFLGGTMRMTVSVCVILLELTNNFSMLPLVMLVILVSKTVADCFNKGVYDQIVKMKGLPYLEAHAEVFMNHLVVGDIVSSPLVTFYGVEKVGNILHALRLTGHNGFPVINEPPFSAGERPELCGLVLRSHLLVLLMGKRFLSEKRRVPPEEVYRWFDANAFAKKGLGKGPRVEDLVITEEEMEMYVDLHPVTNTSPHIVVETMSLAKVAVLFRQLGLRHLCVVPKTPGRPPIVGILTRHDFMPEHIVELYPHFKHTE